MRTRLCIVCRMPATTFTGHLKRGTLHPVTAGFCCDVHMRLVSSAHFGRLATPTGEAFGCFGAWDPWMGAEKDYFDELEEEARGGF